MPVISFVRCAVAALILIPTLSTAQDFDAGVDAYQSGDYATALREFRPLAEQGHAWAQFNLGNSCYNGHGVPQDYAQAARWYRLAAEQGNAKAQFNLGVSYQNGEGVPQDYAHMGRGSIQT